MIKPLSVILLALAAGCGSPDKEAPRQQPAPVSGIDSSDKFPRISDDELLTLVQKQTFRYFWDFGHPVSGLARERSNNTFGYGDEVVTTGGSGFGIMAIVVAVDRQFVTREQGVERLGKIVSFFKNKAQKVHGAFSHWLNGATGAIIPFSEKDNGADLVETSYLMEGLLTAREYFNGGNAAETALRNDITGLWKNVEWSWFRKNNEQNLYWHYSNNFGWAMNMPIKGWNECLVTYIMAASSPTHSIPRSVYDNCWAANGAMKNGASYYGVTLPLGPAYGGPLFFSHYSFLGIDPHGLKDAYADYWEQVQHHALINYKYCVDNPKKYKGYSEAVWGLTASDNNKGYSAHSPDNDLGIISPTAAVSSLPYTPEESMRAIRFFYYKLGDKIWKDYGFVDAFGISDNWYGTSYLAIDQGPEIVMIENYRTGLLWKLLMGNKEIQNGLRKLGFQSPHFK